MLSTTLKTTGPRQQLLMVENRVWQKSNYLFKQSTLLPERYVEGARNTLCMHKQMVQHMCHSPADLRASLPSASRLISFTADSTAVATAAVHRSCNDACDGVRTTDSANLLYLCFATSSPLQKGDSRDNVQ